MKILISFLCLFSLFACNESNSVASLENSPTSSAEGMSEEELGSGGSSNPENISSSSQSQIEKSVQEIYPFNDSLRGKIDSMFAEAENGAEIEAEFIQKLGNPIFSLCQYSSHAIQKFFAASKSSKSWIVDPILGEVASHTSNWSPSGRWLPETSYCKDEKTIVFSKGVIYPFAYSLKIRTEEKSINLRYVIDSKQDESSSISSSSAEFVVEPSIWCEKEGNCGVFVDQRDNQEYRWTQIGKQTWMAQNLNFQIENSICYDHVTKNCEKYGQLYPPLVIGGKTELNRMDPCPEGWHLPSVEEWETLVAFVNPSFSPSEEPLIWDSEGLGETLVALHNHGEMKGSDLYGFSALPAGYFEAGVFLEQGTWAQWLSTSFFDEILQEEPMLPGVILSSEEKISLEPIRGLASIESAHSVRCIKD